MSMVLNSNGRDAQRAELHVCKVLLRAHATTEFAAATASFRRVPARTRTHASETVRLAGLLHTD